MTAANGMNELNAIGDLLLPHMPDQDGVLRPPLTDRLLRMSAALSYTAYTMRLEAWEEAGWRDLTVQLDGQIFSGLEADEDNAGSVLSQLSVSGRLQQIRERMELRPLDQVPGMLRQRKTATSGKAVVMLHPAGDGRYVVAIGFTGTGKQLYDWVSNMRMRVEDGMHLGFLQLTRQFEQNASRITFPKTAKELGMDSLTLQDILEECHSKDSRFLLYATGHSQGGAVLQCWIRRRMQEGVLPQLLCGYGFASPSLMTLDAVAEPWVYPIYHVLNSDDVVPNMGAMIHLGVLLRAEPDDEIRRACYAPDEPGSEACSKDARAVLRLLRSTPDSLLVSMAICSYMIEHTEEEEHILILEQLAKGRPIIERMYGLLDSQIDRLLAFIRRHIASAYQDIVGEAPDEAAVDEVGKVVGAAIANNGLFRLMSQMGAIEIESHNMGSEPGERDGVYQRLVEAGIERMEAYTERVYCG